MVKKFFGMALAMLFAFTVSVAGSAPALAGPTKDCLVKLEQRADAGAKVTYTERRACYGLAGQGTGSISFKAKKADEPSNPGGEDPGTDPGTDPTTPGSHGPTKGKHWGHKNRGGKHWGQHQNQQHNTPSSTSTASSGGDSGSAGGEGSGEAE